MMAKGTCLAPANPRQFILVIAAILTVMAVTTAWADTRGKLAGKLVDAKTKEPITGVNVILVGTGLGASSDIDGTFVILNIPPGTYDVKFSAVGFTSKLVQQVRVSAGETTTLDQTISEEVIQGQEVVVVATRPVVDTRQTSAVNILDRKEINALPVQGLDDIVNLQAGVVEGHFRGGRIGEVQYQVDGVSVNNPYDNSASLSIDKSIIQEVQVVSGTFDAEYGQAMSGVVNAVLKSGTSDRFEVNAQAYGGQYTGSAGRFPHVNRFRPLSIQNLQFSLSGPTFLPNTTFLLSVRRYWDEGYLFGVREFNPLDTVSYSVVNGVSSPVVHPTGDSAIVPMQYLHEWSGQAKLSTRLFANIQLSYQAVVNQSTSHNYSYDWRNNPDGLAEPKRFSIVHGFDFTHTLSPRLFYTINLRQNFYDYNYYKYSDVMDPRYALAQNPFSVGYQFENGAIVHGVDLGRDHQRTNTLVEKLTATWQATSSHLLKAGLEVQSAQLDFGAPGNIRTVTDTLTGLQKFYQIPSDSAPYPHMVTVHPRWFSAYVQDKVELPFLLIRGGVRLELFDANTTVPSDLANPANGIPEVPQSHPVRTKSKVYVAPRLGISYPVSERSSVYFSYGHFYQYPALQYLFGNSDYVVLKYFQEGQTTPGGQLGNPDLKPERTVQYEFGYKGALTETFGLDASVFYKDIRDLLGIEFISLYSGAEYARYTNVDFGSVKGSTISLNYRAGILNTSVDYTYQMAMGNSSDPWETAARKASNQDARPRVVPLNWDQRSTLNVVVGLSEPGNYTATVVTRLQSGVPYTPVLTPGFFGQVQTNSGTKPSSVTVDVRAEKQLQIGSLPISVFARVINVFDAHFVNGFVFPTTGSVDYSLYPASPGNRNTLDDPSRYYTPRRIEVGISLYGSTE